MSTTNEKNNAFLIHLSAFSGYFIPFGSVLIPLIIWNIKKDESEFIDQHGKEAVNFNLSFLLYYTVIIISMVPLLFRTIFNLITHMDQVEQYEQLQHLYSFGGLFSVIGLILLIGTMAVFKFIIIIVASIKAQQGETFSYPLRIKFIK